MCAAIVSACSTDIATLRPTRTTDYGFPLVQAECAPPCLSTRINGFRPPPTQATSAHSARLILLRHSCNPAPGRQSRPRKLKDPSKPHSSPAAWYSQSDHHLHSQTSFALLTRYGAVPVSGTSTSAVRSRFSLNHKQRHADAGMKYIEKEVFIVHVVDIAVVSEQPIRRPRVEEHKGVSLVDELALIRHDCARGHHPIDRERVPLAKVCLELRVRNMGALPSGSRLLCRCAVLVVRVSFLFLF